jgi:thioredoxin 1
MPTCPDTGPCPLEGLRSLNRDNWDREVLQNPRPTLVVFSASWCRACRVYAPVVEQLAGEVGDRATVGKVDADADKDLVRQYQVQALPTTLVFQRGRVIHRLVGVQSKAALQKMLGP